MVNTGILIITNEKKAAHDLREHLIKLGYRVVGIETSNEEIIAKIEETKPDLILTDIRLNGDGIKTGQLINSNFSTPIIYITGSVGETTIQRAKSTGPFGYIFEPFDQKQIYATVETALLRHRLESELREGRRWLNAVLDGINDGVIALDNQRMIRFINPIAEQLTGWSEIETMGKTLHEVFTSIDEESRQRVEFYGIEKVFHPKDTDPRFEGLLVSKNGKTTPIEMDFTIIKDDNGMAAGMVLVFRDITKRREALWEIQRQSQRAEALVETAARLNAQLELTSVLDTVCSISNQALQASATAVFLRDAKQDVYHNMATYTQLTDLEKYNGIRFEIPGSVFESFLSEENPVTLISDIQSYPNLPYMEIFREQNIHTVGIAGLYRQRDLIGVLISIHIGDPIQLPEDTIALLKGLVDQTGIAITNASFFEQIRISRERQQFLTRQLVKVQEDERRSLSRELHDEIGQMLTGLQFTIKSIMAQSTEEERSKLDQIQILISAIISQIRELSINLRPSLLDDLGILPTLIWYFDRYEAKTGIRVSFNHQNLDQRFSPELEITAFRIVQEALTNIARYAEAESVDVKINILESVMQVEIHDQGRGFDITFLSKNQSVGLEGMRERAIAVGGLLEIQSQPGKGTHIHATLPIAGQIERRTRERNHLAGR
jgi:PAS domain S-box-containing protein